MQTQKKQSSVLYSFYTNTLIHL